MKFAVLGVGGVGGFFGAKLAQGGQDVSFIARGAHLEAMKAAGLRIKSTEGEYIIPPGKMTDRPEEIGPVDVVLFCVKSYHTEAASRQMIPLLSEGTVVISLQNGVENEEVILQNIPRGVVFGGVANIYSTISAPGEIAETGGPKKIIFGPIHSLEPHLPKAKNILEHMLHVGINAALSEDIISEIWRKFVFITGVAGITTLTRLTLAEVLAVSQSTGLLVDAMKETEAVGQARGIRLEDGYIDGLLTSLRKFDNNTRSSLYYDLVHGKPLELEALSGTVVRYGRERGIPTPVNDVIYRSLLPYHMRHSTGKTI